MRRDLDQLRILVAVVESGSFTATAAERNSEVSAVSRAVHDLEGAVGVVLFNRLARGVRLTAAGRSYVASARDILERYDQAGVHARQAAARQPFSLSVGYAWSVTSRPMVELLRSFAADHPTVALKAVEASNDDLFARVRSGRLDVAVAASEPPPLLRLRALGPLLSLPLWLESIAAVMPASENAYAVQWSDLANQRLLCRAIDDWPRFVNYIERVGGPTLTFEPHAVSQEGVLALATAGLGWTLIPASVGHLLPSELRAVPITSAGAALQVEAVWRPENANPALTRFLALCRQLHESVPGDAPLQNLDQSP